MRASFGSHLSRSRNEEATGLGLRFSPWPESHYLARMALRGPRRTFVPVGRGDVDNATVALSSHDAHFVLHAQDHAENIRVERRGIAFRGLVCDRANLAFGAGIVHRDIGPAKVCDGLVDQVADFVVAALGPWWQPPEATAP
jgi:hypothetical protein